MKHFILLITLVSAMFVSAGIYAQGYGMQGYGPKPPVTATTAAPKMALMKSDFKDLKSAEALATKGPVVLFFYSWWNGGARNDMGVLDSSGNKLKGDTVLVVKGHDDIRKMFNVKSDDTFVQIDKSGKAIAMWVGGGMNSFLKNLKK
jgi:hypothetical protein